MTAITNSEVISTTKIRWQLFWLSCLVLFAEIMALRWLNIEFNTFKVLPNVIIMVILIAVSAGLTLKESKLAGLGIIKIKGKIAFYFSLAFLLLVLIAAPQLHIYEQSFRLDQNWIELTYSLVFFLAANVALYIIFLTFGVLLAPLFDALPPLTAYTMNLSGSIIGVLFFAAISYLTAPPFVWLLVAGLIVFAVRKRKSDILFICLLACIAFCFNHSSYWSPYSKLDIIPAAIKGDPVFVPGSYLLHSNNSIFHFGINVLPDAELSKYADSQTAIGGHFKQLIVSLLSVLEPPFLCAPKAQKVLVLGAGSGDDVAYAIRKNVQHIDAVEIDPIICSFGRKNHPQHPYLDPRVTICNEDARTFLRYTKEKYDLIEFAFLDPGNTIRAASFLRVDNYVYTVESIKSALRCLSPQGVVSLSFATDDLSPTTHRLYKTIMQAWGSAPFTVINEKYGCTLFLFGPGMHKSLLLNWLSNHPAFKEWSLPIAKSGIRCSTDQWPFLYTDFNYSGIWLYLGTLAVVIVLPSLVIFSGQRKEAKFAELGNMFCLGLAFMLIETKSIVELSLLFGATWLVSSVVIVTILTLALLANLYVQKVGKVPLVYLYMALASTLVLQFFLSVPQTSEWPPAVIAIAACLIACLPIFFSGMIFSACFRKTEQASAFFAANLLGVAFGGLTENLSLIFSIKGLVPIALCIYGLSAICVLISQPKLLLPSGNQASK